MEPSYKVDHSEMWRVPECFRAAGTSERVPVQGKPCLFSGGNVTKYFWLGCTLLTLRQASPSI
jgi:hypothetical protein